MTTQDFADIIRPGVSRGLDFVMIEELRKRTGITPDVALPFALSEMLCNALDKDATQINIEIQEDAGFDRLTISDNGSKKFSCLELQLILDFENKASSKRGFLRVSRGYLGNALKSIMGFSYALAESKDMTPQPITVSSGTSQYAITLKPDRIRAVIESNIAKIDRSDDGFTAFTVKFPRAGNGNSAYLNLKDIVIAFGMVNPTRKITYNLYGQQGNLGKAEDSVAPRHETSILWYTLKQFRDLYEDFLRARPETQLKEFTGMLRGFRRRKIIRDILQLFNHTVNQDLENSDLHFVPTSQLKELTERQIIGLFACMKCLAKPVSKRSIPAVLGTVGEQAFRKVKEQNELERLRYIMLSGFHGSCPNYLNHLKGPCDNIDHVEYPYLVELAVFDRGDNEGLKVYQCVNFMASPEPIFEDIFQVYLRLGEVGIREDSSVTLIVHLVCPVLQWLNYGKSRLAHMDSCQLIKKAFDILLPIPKQPRIYRTPPPPRPLSWVPHGKIGDPIYEERLSSFAAELKIIQTKMASIVKPGSRGWCYQIEGLNKIDKGEFNACQKAITDCIKIGLLPPDFVAEDQDLTRHFKGIHIASDPRDSLKQIRADVAEFLSSLPSSTTDYWVGEKYYVMICVEKGDLLSLFRPVCQEYHVPLVSSKGWSPVRLRFHIADLSKKAEEKGLTPVLLLFYDYDPAGWKITKTFRKNLNDCRRGTGWSPAKLQIERFGLNKDDITQLGSCEETGLTWIDNLKTSSDKEPRPSAELDEYMKEAGGRRKCEGNALFRNNETQRAGMEICRKVIEKFYGADAKERFAKKEKESREKLSDIYGNKVWADFDITMHNIIDSLAVKETEDAKAGSGSAHVSEKEIDVLIDNKHYGQCPRCGTNFNYSENDYGRLVRCRGCKLPMRIRLA